MDSRASCHWNYTVLGQTPDLITEFAPVKFLFQTKRNLTCRKVFTYLMTLARYLLCYRPRSSLQWNWTFFLNLSRRIGRKREKTETWSTESFLHDSDLWADYQISDNFQRGSCGRQPSVSSLSESFPVILDVSFQPGWDCEPKQDVFNWFKFQKKSQVKPWIT